MQSEKIWSKALHEDFVVGSNEARWWAEHVTWYGPGGIGTARSRSDYVEHFLKPLRTGFVDLTMQTDLVVCEGKYCGAHFYLYGNHSGTWLGEPATWKTVPIRCGAHARIEDGRIVEGWLIIDQPRAFHAMGVDLYARARNHAMARAQVTV